MFNVKNLQYSGKKIQPKIRLLTEFQSGSAHVLSDLFSSFLKSLKQKNLKVKEVVSELENLNNQLYQTEEKLMKLRLEKADTTTVYHSYEELLKREFQLFLKLRNGVNSLSNSIHSAVHFMSDEVFKRTNFLDSEPLAL